MTGGHIHFKVKFRSNIYSLEISRDEPIGTIFTFLGEVIDFNRLHCKLIVAGSSYHADDASFPTISSAVKPGQTLLLLSSSVEEIEKIQNFKSDPLVKGFVEEARDEQRRALRTSELENENPWGGSAKQDREFNFARLEVLYKRQVPSPFEAEKLLKKLSLDPAIIDILTTRKWTVGTLCEIDPEDADIEQAAKGEGEKCLLGWNRNFGQRIALRLRTDDFKGFRNYQSITNTLLHELAHNVFGPHDDKFWSLFAQLKEQYSRVHSGRKNAKMLGSVAMAPRPVGAAHLNVASGHLGGSTQVQDMDELRAARIQALQK